MCFHFLETGCNDSLSIAHRFLTGGPLSGYKGSMKVTKSRVLKGRYKWSQSGSCEYFRCLLNKERLRITALAVFFMIVTFYFVDFVF